MLSEYYNKDISEIKNKFRMNYEESIKILLCNLKLENTIAKFNNVIVSLKEDESDKIKLFSDITNVKNDELCEFINNKSLACSQRNKCFIELYEEFTDCLSDIVEYIHYKKPQIVFNIQNKKFDGSTIYSILEDKDNLTNIIKGHINESVNKYAYNKSTMKVLDFIYSHIGIELSDSNKQSIQIANNVRNILVHNKGDVTERDWEKLLSIVDDKKVNRISKIEIQEEAIKRFLNVYIFVINQICDNLK